MYVYFYDDLEYFQEVHSDIITLLFGPAVPTL